MNRYIALPDRDATRGYGVAFPDFPAAPCGRSRPAGADQRPRPRDSMSSMLEDEAILNRGPSKSEKGDAGLVRDRLMVLVPVAALEPSASTSPRSQLGARSTQLPTPWA